MIAWDASGATPFSERGALLLKITRGEFSKRAPRSEKGVAPNASQAIMRTLLTTQTPLAVRHFWVSRAAFIRGIKSRLDHASGRRSSAYFNRLCPTAEEAWVPSLVHSHMDHVLLVCARIIKFYPTSPIPIAARYVWVYRAAILRTLRTTQTPLAGRHFWVSRAAIIQGIKSRLDHAMIWRAQYIRGARSESQRGGAAPLTVQSGRRACNERAPPSGHGAVHSAEIP